MSCTSKKTAFKFRKEYKINKLTLSALSEVLTKQGYTVVNYNSLYNESDVENLIKALNLSDLVNEFIDMTPNALSIQKKVDKLAG